ncbi:YlxM family DNA-binding protein [Paenibacillus cisolokensis]|nr:MULTISPECIES: YlxM family DNA-binding protein [Paenibacillus]
MREPDALAKTNRINMLIDFYEPLLTDKQRTFLKYYFHDDFTLGEIAAESGISRQAVYEHVKRASLMLESYEEKLGLLARHNSLVGWIGKLEETAGLLPENSEARMRLLEIAEGLKQSEQIGKTVVNEHGV